MNATVSQHMQRVIEKEWWPMRRHPEQHRLWTSNKRFRVICGGRRTMKSTIAMRYGIRKALAATHLGFWGVFSAPTYRQAKEIYWSRLKRLCPPFMVARVSETELTIELKNMARLSVIGLDRPERIEGAERLDFIVLDEFQEMRDGNVWSHSVYPMLSDWRGEGWIQGKPHGKNHFFRFFQDAQLDDRNEWDAFHWTTADVFRLYPEHAGKVEQAERDLDPLSFAQEYNASFVDPAGLAYYRFGDHNVAEGLDYNPWDDLHVCFDFNRVPGVCAVAQYPRDGYGEPEDMIHFIGEVFLQHDSTTERVCDLFLDGQVDRQTRYRHHAFREHKGEVFIYGDATGGAKGSAKVKGSDYDLIRGKLQPVFRDRLYFRVPKENPPQRVRINSFNARLKSADGTVRILMDKRCRWLIRDMGAVTCDETGEIEKATRARDKEPQLETHISDAAGYFIHERHPIGKVAARFEVYA